MSAVQSVLMEAVHDFASKAEAYCLLLEQSENYSVHEFAVQCAGMLASLYQAALSLPDLDPCDEHVDLEAISGMVPLASSVKIAKRLKPYDWFYFVFDPFKENAEAIMSTFADGLDDIYRELQRGLRDYRRDDACGLRNAAWEWKFGFQSHWGHHAVTSLAALHWLISNHILPGVDGEALSQ